MQTIIGIDINKAATLLKDGELVAVPTETVYGLAANALNEDAVLKIYLAKNRPRFNPLILHVATFDKLKEYAKDIPEACNKLASAFSPGPISFLLNKKKSVPDLITAGSKKVVIRIPNHPLLLALLRQIDFPIAAPSANPSGFVSPVTAQHVYEGLQGKVPYILDGGDCSVGLESTIVGFENGKTILYRLGGISKEAIETILGNEVELNLTHNAPDTPGQLKSHYATATPLYFGNAMDLIKKYAGKNIVVITLDKKFTAIISSMQFQLSASGDLNEAARNLFKTLRLADELNADLIIAESMPDKDLGTVINDRLQKAQHINKIV